jgi:uncharacterized protein
VTSAAPSTTLRVVPLPRFAGEEQAPLLHPRATGEGDRRRRWWGLQTLALAIAFAFIATLAHAAPKFPALTGRVVDDAHILSADTQAQLTSELEGLETKTGRQVVVVTLPDLQGYSIEDYGYQLGRTWAIGHKGQNDGVLFIVAPTERKVRIEVGYGLEPVLTDALSSVILQEKVLPKFRAKDMQGGVVDGTRAIIQQLSLPDAEAKAQVDRAATTPARHGHRGSPFGAIIGMFFMFWIITAVLGALGGRRRGGGMGGAWWLLPLLLSSSQRRGDWGGGGGWGGGSWGGGGGGFSGGGGSFGGGGSSGGW